MKLHRVILIPLAAGVMTLAGCAASYEDRMSFLDEMSTKGIEYRKQLQKQGTEPSEKACDDGYVLLDPNIPDDSDGGGTTPKWRDQVREAYIKSCLTGEARPKPDPSGVKAVTPVPHRSTTPTTTAPSPSASS